MHVSHKCCQATFVKTVVRCDLHNRLEAWRVLRLFSIWKEGTVEHERTAELYRKQGHIDIEFPAIDTLTQCEVCKEHRVQEKRSAVADLHQKRWKR